MPGKSSATFFPEDVDPLYLLPHLLYGMDFEWFVSFVPLDHGKLEAIGACRARAKSPERMPYQILHCLPSLQAESSRSNDSSPRAHAVHAEYAARHIPTSSKSTQRRWGGRHHVIWHTRTQTHLTKRNKTEHNRTHSSSGSFIQ